MFFRSIDLGACSADPCLNGGTCVSLSDGLDFQCNCVAGFTGRRCDFGKTSFLLFYCRLYLLKSLVSTGIIWLVWRTIDRFEIHMAICHKTAKYCSKGTQKQKKLSRFNPRDLSLILRCGVSSQTGSRRISRTTERILRP